MPNIETTEDLLRLLDENPEFLEAVRRKILTDELMRLPAEFSAFRQETRERFEGIDRHFERIDERFTGIDERFERIEERLERLDGDVQTLKSDGEILKGYGLESVLPTRGLSMLAERLDLRRARIVRATGDSRGSEDFTDRLWNALDSGTITRREYRRILRTDMVVRAERHTSRGTPFYIAVEASFTADADDTERVALSAQILRKVIPDTEVVPALFYSEISETDLKEAEAEGITTIEAG